MRQLELVYERSLGVVPTPPTQQTQFTAFDYLNRGTTYNNLRQYDAALADYDQAIELDPSLAQAYSNRGMIYAELQQYDAALADYGHAIDLDPNFAQAYSNRGAIYRDLQQYDAALADFNKAIELNPTDAQAYFKSGMVLGNCGKLRESLTYFEKATQLGHPQGAQLAANTREGLAFEMFQKANSVEEMKRTVAELPFLTDVNFIAAVEQAVTEQVSPEHRPAFEQCLAWLRQIVSEQTGEQDR